MDNNAAEGALRVVALGRKNYLFAGSDRGGERAAFLAAACSLLHSSPLPRLLNSGRSSRSRFSQRSTAARVLQAAS